MSTVISPEAALEQLTKMYAGWPTARLLQAQQQFERNIAQFGGRNPGWVANCAEPNIQLIGAELAQRPAC